MATERVVHAQDGGAGGRLGRRCFFEVGPRGLRGTRRSGGDENRSGRTSTHKTHQSPSLLRCKCNVVSLGLQRAERRDTLTGRGEMRVSVDYDFRAVQASPHAASLHAYPRCR